MSVALVFGYHQTKTSFNVLLQGASIIGRFLLVDPLFSHQHHPLPPTLLSHHPSYHHLHHGQVQCDQTRGISKRECLTSAGLIFILHLTSDIVMLWCCFLVLSLINVQIKVCVPDTTVGEPLLPLWLSESHHHPILSHPSAVVFLRLASYHRLLLCLLRSTLDPVGVWSELSCWEFSDFEDFFTLF